MKAGMGRDACEARARLAASREASQTLGVLGCAGEKDSGRTVAA